MHIALFHDSIIPALKYGGTERVVQWLVEDLLDLDPALKLTLICQKSPQGDRWRRCLRQSHEERLSICETANYHSNRNTPVNFDLIHYFSPPPPTEQHKCIVTIGGNGKLGEEFHRNTVFVSRRHAENHSSTQFIYNGVRENLYYSNSNESIRRDLIFLAKASWKVKNLAGAIKIARLSKRRLIVLGSRDYPLHLQRLVSQLLSHISGVVYYGGATNEEKAEIMSSAYGFLFPVRWHEPFGIAVIEAMASGLPVFATPYGSLPEIITPATGFLSDSSALLAKAINQNTYDRNYIRQYVCNTFSSRNTAAQYYKLYQTIITQPETFSLNPIKPKCRQIGADAIPGLSSATLLPFN